jgi:hypothetical protein
MNKRKAGVCTALFAIIVFALYGATVFIENSNGMTLYEYMRLMLFPWMCGNYMAKLTIRFNEWLTKETKE